MVAREIDPWLGHQGGQPGNEVQGLEDDMRGTIPVRRLQLVANIAMGCQRQTRLRNGRAGDVAAQTLQLAPLVAGGGHPGMQRKTGDFHYQRKSVHRTN